MSALRWLRDHLMPVFVVKVSMDGTWLALEANELHCLRDYFDADDRPRFKIIIRTRAWLRSLPDFDGF